MDNMDGPRWHHAEISLKDKYHVMSLRCGVQTKSRIRPTEKNRLPEGWEMGGRGVGFQSCSE